MHKHKKIVSVSLAIIMLLILSVPVLAADMDEISVGAKSVHEKKDFVCVDVLEIAADVLGMSKAEVKEAIKTGKLGGLLLAAGKLDAFKSAYLAELNSKLDEAVADGKMTRADADARKAKVEEKMAGYDGTTHLCDDKNHGKTGVKREDPKKSDGDATSRPSGR